MEFNSNMRQWLQASETELFSEFDAMHADLYDGIAEEIGFEQQLRRWIDHAEEGVDDETCDRVLEEKIMSSVWDEASLGEEFVEVDASSVRVLQLLKQLATDDAISDSEQVLRECQRHFERLHEAYCRFERDEQRSDLKQAQRRKSEWERGLAECFSQFLRSEPRPHPSQVARISTGFEAMLSAWHDYVEVTFGDPKPEVTSYLANLCERRKEYAFVLAPIHDDSAA